MVASVRGESLLKATHSSGWLRKAQERSPEANATLDRGTLRYCFLSWQESLRVVSISRAGVLLNLSTAPGLCPDRKEAASPQSASDENVGGMEAFDRVRREFDEANGKTKITERTTHLLVFTAVLMFRGGEKELRLRRALGSKILAESATM